VSRFLFLFTVAKKLNELFSEEQKSAVQAAIAEAELNTSGEIRVHIAHTSNHEDPVKQAIQVFEKLGMHQTALRNGVLFFVSIKDRKLSIIGDKGINDVVDGNFWDSTRDVMITQFKAARFTEGLIEGILKAGQQLKNHFPIQQDDTNELSNEMSFEDEEQ
jgi:uncharacterized membrane protein